MFKLLFPTSVRTVATWHNVFQSQSHHNQGVHTQTIFELVWVNWFPVTGFEEPLAFTLFVWNWFRLHVITYSPVEYRDNGLVFGGVGEDDTIIPH